ncbi:uncharacterized membrane protein DDB_G0293934-like [Cydia pomonella]|uniref:uncharacterized membrane protein DDB_G0293934-like n=1 Tax=Cydia pomonella TaxID=82600 RepID=UPI002ADE6C54|nr:uncharacterized membrane protein DDB_G0293934-like [Cydia pomonella]
MFRYSIVFLCAILVLTNVDFIQAGRFGGGGGSRSGGYGGGGRHSYPSSGGLSGGGSRHSYPSSGGLSGGGSHSYPSGGGSHSYPNSGGSHTYPNSGGSHTYPNSGGHKYPPSSGNSGTHTYPNSGSGLSGSNNHGYNNRGGSSGGTTNIHHHYHYNPPQQIHYASPHGGPAMSYPVYRGTPPTYVYQYKDSGSKYSSLLAGLALFNLGALAGGVAGYGIGHHSSSNNNNYQSYKTQPGEVCLFGIKKDNGDFEETRIDCQLISSFIYAEQAKQQQPQNSQNQTTVTTTVTNTTIVNMTNPQDTPSYVLSPNGTLVTPGAVPDAGNVTNGAPANGGTVTSSVSVTTTNTTVVNAVDVKGAPIQVTPGMQCYVMRRTPSSRMKHEVPCGLLQTYADKSIKRNSAARNVPAFTILAVICAVFVAY